MAKRVSRPGVREGYDRWSAAYDSTPNPLVALDRRTTLHLLRPRPQEQILDAGCGTGANLHVMLRARSRPVGVDLSRGMLRVAKHASPGVPLAQADLNRELPFARRAFDALLCALVSEHLTSVRTLFREAFAVLRQGGRLVFSAFHPEMAAAGIEANFREGEVEYRLGAERHTVEDYLQSVREAGFRELRCKEYLGDARLVEEVPWAGKYVGYPLLLTIEAVKPISSAT